MDFLETSVVDLAARVRSGELTAVTLVEHALDRIDALNPAINAFVAVDADAALQAAEQVDQAVRDGKDPGALAGIPIGVKDLEDAIGFVTTFGSPLHADDAPAETDSLLVARLKAAGAIVIGKTNTPEFGHKGTTDNPLFGATANPWNLECTPGGSSGGSAAAIASGMVPLATGSDGGGSIRIPSALCGLTGLKCQQGRVPYHQDGQSPSMLLSVGGPMARTARDTAWRSTPCAARTGPTRSRCPTTSDRGSIRQLMPSRPNVLSGRRPWVSPRSTLKSLPVARPRSMRSQLQVQR